MGNGRVLVNYILVINVGKKLLFHATNFVVVNEAHIQISA